MANMNTTLVAVEVYPDRARLTRRGEAVLEPGIHQLEITDLPLQMNPDSARSKARGTARARLMGMQVQKVFYSETPAGQVRELEEKLEAAQDELLGLDAQIELVQKERVRLDSLAGHTEIFATALASGETEVETQLALFDSLRERAGQLDGEALKLLADKRALNRRIEQLKKQLEKMRGARPRERYTAIIDIEILEAGDLSVELSYVVSNAGWKPLYDLRLIEEQDEPTLEVGYLAQVTQRTGEDWDAVAMTLSTARPALAAKIPELNPWYVQPMPVPTARRAGVRPAAAMAMKAAAPAPQDHLTGAVAEDEKVQTFAEEVTTSVDTSGAAITYQVPGQIGVLADGNPHKVTVARYSLPPKLDYVTAPKLVDAVYRRAKVNNDSPYTLLPGPANLFAGDEFIGTTHLDLTAPQGELELFLGVDDRIKVERELKRRDVDKSLLGGKRRVRYGYEICLENVLPVDVAILVHDQIPASRHEDIKVRLESAAPEPTEQSELNLLEWELPLASKQELTIRYDFTVEYPQAMEVVGLP